MRVLVVDDSVVHRSQIKKALGTIPGVEVVGTASNGRLALQLIEQKSVQLVTLDLNMPDMDGLALLSELGTRGQAPNVIVFATPTAHLERDRRKALSLGAADFVLKPISDTLDFDLAYAQIARELVPTVQKLLKAQPSRKKWPKAVEDAEPKAAIDAASFAPVDLAKFEPQAIVIASSTGGPQALETLFKALHSGLDVPVFIAQHMPPPFTSFLAQRLGMIGGVECSEGIHGEKVRSGVVYVAPADYHMRVIERSGHLQIALNQEDKVNGVRPAADILFASVADVFGKSTMSFVLTGMGSDGCAGARLVKSAGGAVMIQDKETSVVWGMPGSVFASKAFDKVGSIEECALVFAQMGTRKRGNP